MLLALQADTEAFRGRLGKAREFTRKAIRFGAPQWRPGDGSGLPGSGALREAEFGNTERARQEAAAALTLNPGGVTGTLAALAEAQAGNAARVLALAGDLRKQRPLDTLLNQYWLPTIHAAVEIAHENPLKAIELLQETTRYDLAVPLNPTNVVLYPVYLRGEAYLRVLRGYQAATEFEKTSTTPA